MSSLGLFAVALGVFAILVGVVSTAIGAKFGNLVSAWLGGFNVAGGIHCILLAVAYG